MYKLTNEQAETVIDALNMALASNKRMQISKPKFKPVFDKIEADLNAIKLIFASTPSK